MPRIKPMNSKRQASAARAQEKKETPKLTKEQKRPPRSLYILLDTKGCVTGSARTKKLAEIDLAEGEVVYGPYVLAERTGND